MNNNIHVTIAGVTTRLICDCNITEQVRKIFSSFVTENPCDYIIVVKIASDSLSDTVVQTEASIADGCFHICCEEFIGHVDLSTKQGVISTSSDWPFESLASFLRSFYSAIIFHSGGLMLHSAGIVKDGKAYIFFGPSGIGKTTVVRNSSEHFILSDELVAIKCDQGQFGAYGTPYGKEDWNEATGPHPIAGLFKLVQDNEVFLEELSHARASFELLTISRAWDSLFAVDKVFHVTENLARDIPCFALHFRPDNSFWRCIDDYVNCVPSNI